MESDNKGYLIENNTIIIQRNLSELDIFVKDFIRILEKHSKYLIVSGYISICTGRTRGTEDIDILVPLKNKDKFINLFNDLSDNGFWCYQGENPDEIYDYIEKLKNIRFAKINEVFPNIEFVPIDKTKKSKYFEFSHLQKIRIKDFEFNGPPIEFEILYKETVLKGDKDLDDAKHLRVFFKDLIKEERFKDYKRIIEDDLK